MKDKFSSIVITAIFVIMLAMGLFSLWLRYHGTLTYNKHAMVTLTAPLTLPDGREFIKWDGCPVVSGTRGEICHIDPDSPPREIAPRYSKIAPGKP